jgi:uncharacterized protein
MTDITKMASVVGVAPNQILIEVSSTEEYAQLQQRLEIGSYLKISDDSGSAMIAIVQSYRIRDRLPGADGTDVGEPTFIIDAQPVGRLEDDKFRRGGKQIAIPPKYVAIASSELLGDIYDIVDPAKRFSFGALAQDTSVRVSLDGDKFFGKHIGVVGSTGSGKSAPLRRSCRRASVPQQSRPARGSSTIPTSSSSTFMASTRRRSRRHA